MASVSSVESWVALFLEEVLELTKVNTLEWCKVLSKLGVDDDTKTQWKSRYVKYLVEMHQDLCEGAVNVQNKMLDSIEELLQQSENLCKELQIKMPAHGSSNLSLFEEKKLLQTRVKEYEAQVTARRNELSSLKKRQVDVCRCLGKEPRHVLDSPLPTQDEVSDFWRHVESLENEKFKREGRYLELKSDILNVANELGIRPSLDLEKVVFSDDDSLFVVTDSNMKWLEEYFVSVQKQREQTKTEIANLRDGLHSMWELLQEDIKTCGEFMERHTGNSLQTLEALKSELRRCEELKKANIEKLIKKIRLQIEKMWDKCHMTTTQREEFYYFQDTLYTEDLLTLHDMEITKLNKYYDSNKELFTLLEKREHLWERMLTIEEGSSAPDRLKNRGGQLLKEEKERNKLQKSIPEIEDRLVKLASNYEECYGKPFTSKGLLIADIIAKSHELHDTNKKQKLSARKQRMELTPGKTGLSSLASSTHKTLQFPSTPSTGNKRKLATPIFSGKRKTPTNNALHTAPPRITVTVASAAKRSRHSLERKKRFHKLRRLSKSMAQKSGEATSSDATFYNDFEMEISTKQSCRSTVFQDPCCSSSVLAVPLPTTPKSVTPKSMRTLNKQQASNTALKLKPSGAMKLDF